MAQNLLLQVQDKANKEIFTISEAGEVKKKKKNGLIEVKDVDGLREAMVVLTKFIKKNYTYENNTNPR